MSLAELMAQHRRIALLRALSSAPGYRANESLLHQFLDELGLECSRDQVRTELFWLQDQGLIAVDELAGIYLAKITRAGEDVASGRTTVPGVKRPAPS